MCEGGGGQLLPGASLPDPGQQMLNSTYCGTIPQTFTERDGPAWISVVYSVERAVQPDPAFIGSWGPWTRWEVEEEVERVLNRLFSVGVDDVGFEELRLGMGSALSAAPGALTAALVVMEAANKVLHREGRIHLI